MTLKIGDKAPDFTLPSDSNPSVSLSSFHGKKVVLYFYPKDDTPGCTQEACDFRDQTSQFAKNHAVILGISKDSPTKHQKFKEKYQLPFTLLADENGEVCQAYDVIQEKNMYGKKVLGIQRSTFLIDEKGIIRAIWRKVKVAEHIDQILLELSGA